MLITCVSGEFVITQHRVKKDAVGMKGYRVWHDQGHARGRFCIPTYLVAFSISLTDILPLT